MKIRYQNGFSISLWSNEFKEIEVTDEVIKYQTQDGQWIRIKVPSQWSQNSSSSSSEPLSPPANELARESNNSVGAFPISPPPDMMDVMQRQIDGLQMTWDVKIAELAREVRSIPEVNLKELETKILDRVEAIREDHWDYLQTDCDNIRKLTEEALKFRKNFKEIDCKLNNVHEVINIIINHDRTLRDKMGKILQPMPESDKGIKKG
jgi:hypothetical protein